MWDLGLINLPGLTSPGAYDEVISRSLIKLVFHTKTLIFEIFLSIFLRQEKKICWKFFCRHFRQFEKNSKFFRKIFFRNFFFHFFQIVWNACKKIFSKFFFVQLSKNTWKKTRKFSKKCNMTPSIWDICAKKLVVTKVNKAVILIITKQILD